MPDPALRALHVLTDRKFIPWIKRTFTRPGWESTYLILSPPKSANKQSEDQALHLRTDDEGKAAALNIIAKHDLVFYYLLDNFKADLISSSPSTIVHCWCYYGAEIYQQTNLFRERLYGPETRKLFWTMPEVKYRYDLRKWYYQLIRFKPSPIQSLKRAIPKIHALLWYVPEEIERINHTITLPQFQFFQFFSFTDIIPNPGHLTVFSQKKILIGNSATIENNHLDVLPALQQLSDKDYQFSLPMTYGQFPRYKNKIIQRFSKALQGKVYFLEQHVKLDDYYDILLQHPTAIFLHYRQQALGNILYLLYVGSKVYLSRQNVVVQWLRNHGVEVAIFEEDFKRDAEQQNLVWNMEVVEKNRNAISGLLDQSRNEETFHLLTASVRQQI